MNSTQTDTEVIQSLEKLDQKVKSLLEVSRVDLEQAKSIFAEHSEIIKKLDFLEEINQKIDTIASIEDWERIYQFIDMIENSQIDFFGNLADLNTNYDKIQDGIQKIENRISQLESFNSPSELSNNSIKSNGVKLPPKSSHSTPIMTDFNLEDCFTSIPENAAEPIVSQEFVILLLEALGFKKDERCPGFSTGYGGQVVDFAARKNTDNDIFMETQKDPFLLVEVKGRNIDISQAKYKSTVAQLRRYLSPKATHCKTAQWGIITNQDYIQLFCRHGKVIFPVTQLIKLTVNNINEKIQLIKNHIDTTSKALTVTVYNNKGGVGKTTTVINLAAALSFKKKVLVIDFDANQKDLTTLLDIQPQATSFYSCLADYRRNHPSSVICRYFVTSKSGKEVGFDVIPADEVFVEKTQNQLLSEVTRGRLRQVLAQLKNTYDYILIDSPPNWMFFSQEAILAADVVLLPTKHNNLSSLLNAQQVITKFLPEIGETLREFLTDAASPTALPIFYNGEKATDAQKVKAQEVLKKIIHKIKQEQGIDLLPYFFPKCTTANKNLDIYEIPNSAYIASAAFDHKPAAYQSKIAYDCYASFAQEYFLG